MVQHVEKLTAGYYMSNILTAINVMALHNIQTQGLGWIELLQKWTETFRQQYVEHRS